MSNRVIRQFEERDMAALGVMYAQVSAQEDVLFWWVGGMRAIGRMSSALLKGEQMVAKGQLQLFNVVPPGRAAESKHKIFRESQDIARTGKGSGAA
ncbi:hypothetical protein ACFTAO_05490 [Paenibacillus rhizoplanae]